MHHLDPKDHKDKLYCAFCRNPLTNQEMVVKKFDGDFVSVWCEPCSKLDKQWGPKFLVCCCSEEPRELDVEMAKGEIKQSKQLVELSKEVKDVADKMVKAEWKGEGIKIELEKPVEFVNIPVKDDDNKEDEPKEQKKKGFKSKLRNL